MNTHTHNSYCQSYIANLRAMREQFPHISKELVESFAIYETERQNKGHENMTVTPLIPARISSRHPMAH